MELPVLSVQVVRYTAKQIEEQESSSAPAYAELFSTKQLPLLPIKLVHYKAEDIEEEIGEGDFFGPTSAPTCAQLFPEYNVCQLCKDIGCGCNTLLVLLAQWRAQEKAHKERLDRLVHTWKEQQTAE